MKQEQAWRFVCGCCWALLLAGSGAHAGEAPPQPEAAPPGPAEKKTDEYKVEPGDRRDPFSFAKTVPEPARNDDKHNPDDPENQEGRAMGQQEIQQRKQKALEKYQLGELALMNMNANDALAQCDEGLNVFKDVKIIPRELQEPRDQLLRLRKAADRVHLRQDAERDFNALSLRLTGVVARDKNSQAIVNTQIVTKGSIVPTSQEGVEVVVADILPQQVIFIFKGYRMTLTLSDSK